MKKILFSLVLLVSTLAFAQQDIPVNSGRFTYFDIARGVSWNGSGSSTINNNYLWTPRDSDSGVCVYFANNDSGSHSFNLNVYFTGDPSIQNYTGYTSKWVILTQIPSTVTVSGSSTTSVYLRPTGVARLAINISGGSGAGTVDVYAIQSSINSCGQLGSNQQIQGIIPAGNNGFSGSQPLVNPLQTGGMNASGNVVTETYTQTAESPSNSGVSLFAPYLNTDSGCNKNATISATAGTTGQIVALQGGKVIYVCGFSLSMSAAGTISFVYGTGSNCGTGQAIITPAITLATGTPLSAYPGGGAFVFKTTIAGQALCITAVTGNVTGFLTYAQF